MKADQQLPIPFDDYDVSGVRKYGRGHGRFWEQVADHDAQFWSLFGHIPGEGLQCIGDFDTREHAEEVYARITARPYHRAGDKRSKRRKRMPA